LQIEIPSPPSPELNPNQSWKLHWGQKARATREFKQLVYLYALQAKPADWIAPEKASLQLTFITKDQRMRDADNLLAAAKPVFDALVSAGLIKGDDFKHLVIEGVEIRMDKDNSPKTLLKIEEAKDGTG
jgi:Holliday junction resolvase RusA-like endonuclease